MAKELRLTLALGVFANLLACNDDFTCGISSLHVTPQTCVRSVAPDFVPTYAIGDFDVDACVETHIVSDFDIAEPMGCNPNPSDDNAACSGTVTITCASGEVTTTSVHWANGCTPSPKDLLVCKIGDASTFDGNLALDATNESGD